MTTPSLRRHLGLGGAVSIGLASMIGAGVFSVWAPAAHVAGAWLLIGLALAGVVAFANATSTARLSADFPQSGGVYHFGRQVLGPWPGFLAGWGFLVGKTASCAAMALTAAAYLAPPEFQRLAAVVAVLVVVGINLCGISRTARAATVIAACSLTVLAVVVVAAVTFRASQPLVANPLDSPPTADGFIFGIPASPELLTIYGVLQSAGLLFFAFAGYARVATLGEEVRSPKRTIPRAITLALCSVLVVYATVGALTLLTLGPEALADSSAPLRDVVTVAGWSWAAPLVQLGAGIAALGALLALVAGISRTALAMARDHELPPVFATVRPTLGVPVVAELGVGVLVVALVVFTDIRGAIGFSSFGVLCYYLFANLAAIKHTARGRWLALIGVVGCLVLLSTLPAESIASGLVMFAVGAGYRVTRLTVRGRKVEL